MRSHHRWMTLDARFVLGVPISDLGALIVGVGAILLLIDAASGSRGIINMTWGGTLPQPRWRMSAAAELVGSVLAALGSALLLIGAKHLTTLTVVVVVVVALGLL